MLYIAKLRRWTSICKRSNLLFTAVSLKEKYHQNLLPNGKNKGKMNNGDAITKGNHSIYSKTEEGIAIIWSTD